MRLHAVLVASLLAAGCSPGEAPAGPRPTAKRTEGSADETKTADDSTSGACRIERVATLARTLEETEPRARAQRVALELGKACTLPSFATLKLAVATGFAGGGEQAPPRPDPSEWKQAYERACPGSHEVVTSIAHSEQEGRAAKLFDGCNFGRYDIVEREVFAARASASPLPFILFQWLVDQGVEGDAARTIARALELLDRRHRSAVRRDAGIEVPRVSTTLDPVPRWSKVEVSMDALRVGTENLARLDQGRLAPSEVTDHRIGRMHAALGSMNNRPDDVGLTLIVDGRVPFVTLADVLHTVAEAGLERVGVVAETGVYQYAMAPLRVVRAGERRSETPTVTVEIDDRGFMLTAAESPEAAPVRTEDHAAASLIAKLDAHRDALSASPRVTIVPRDEITTEALVQALVALRPVLCAGDECSIPDVELGRGWLP
ncbi:MAG: hypothetical protein AAF799_30950 [Myxococcota bacterium]